MSLVITGTNTLIILFFLIGLNAFMCYKKKPIVGFAVALVSIIFLLAFQIDYTGINIILTLILMVFVLGNILENYENYKK